MITDRQQRLWYKTQESVDAIVSRQMIQRVLLGDEIARTVLFLASDDSRMITKQSIIVDARLSDLAIGARARWNSRTGLNPYGLTYYLGLQGARHAARQSERRRPRGFHRARRRSSAASAIELLGRLARSR